MGTGLEIFRAIMSHAQRRFQKVQSPNVIAAGIWRAVLRRNFEFPIIQEVMGEDQVILTARTVLCRYVDGVFRPFALVHVIDTVGARTIFDVDGERIGASSRALG